MEAVVYEESPLADYIHQEAGSWDFVSHEPTNQSDFAPHGAPSLRTQWRQARHSASRTSRAQDERFLEQFRYTIIASQLLDDHAKPQRDKIDIPDIAGSSWTLTGVLISATISFSLAWAVHFVRSRAFISSAQVAFLLLASLLLITILGTYGRRQYVQHIRRAATNKLSVFLDASHTCDDAIGAAFKFIQEVEVVARGYAISHPLPPIIRLEESGATLRCPQLRRTLARELNSLTRLYFEAHEILQASVASGDVEKYHDIYDISHESYFAAMAAREGQLEGGDGLKDLRLAYRAALLARKLMLCDLLALTPQNPWPEIRQWATITPRLMELAAASLAITKDIGSAMSEEETKGWSSLEDVDTLSQVQEHEGVSDGEPLTPGKRQVKAQLRRLDALANGIRALHAKMHILREEAEALVDGNNDTATLAATLSRQYHTVGGDIRGLLLEWEQARSTMMLRVEPPSRISRSSSGLILSPVSPSPSLGGSTTVDEGPAEALRILNGGDRRRTPDFSASDEEVLETIVMPRKHMSVTLTREEKKAKLEDDRRKRATLQEHAENTTNMLRELRMVIKHRPHGRTTLSDPAPTAP